MLDPGHGGADSGAVLNDGLPEKDVALHLAAKLNTVLGQTYEAALTRGEDIAVSNTDRAGKANNAEAGVFLSLHAAMGWTPGSSGITVWVHDPMAGASATMAEDIPGISHTPWESQQSAHVVRSSALARLILRNIELRIPESRPRTGALPLPLLAGVDCPAVIIELEEKFTRRPWADMDAAMDLLAQALSDSLAEYFGE
jgi:N-acetylmuramoyl-L-alanine amidase